MKPNERLAEIERTIVDLQQEATALQKEADAAASEQAREQYGVQIVCFVCNGTGKRECGGADIISDPPYEVLCLDCNGEGFRWAMR